MDLVGIVGLQFGRAATAHDELATEEQSRCCGFGVGLHVAHPFGRITHHDVRVATVALHLYCTLAFLMSIIENSEGSFGWAPFIAAARRWASHVASERGASRDCCSEASRAYAVERQDEGVQKQDQGTSVR